jgi:hypothetical protein
MNAVANGFGFIVPTPRTNDFRLGSIVYIDEQGFVRWVGNIFDDDHFKILARQNAIVLNNATTEERHPSCIVAFTTGSMNVQPLPEEDISRQFSFWKSSMISSIVLGNETQAMDPDVKPLCGWLLTRKPRANGPGNAIILGPNLCKVHLDVPMELITQWVRDAPRKATIWTARQRKLFPKHQLLVVLEQWTTPTWMRVSWDKKDCNTTRSALGLLPTGCFLPCRAKR